MDKEKKEKPPSDIAECPWVGGGGKSPSRPLRTTNLGYGSPFC